jgi:branched-chain amino acid transport system ATP-binding protein
MDDVILRGQGVTKRFGGLVAVDRVDLEVRRGMIASLIGPNGAGKTTFFNCVTGFYVPDDGDILFQGRSIRGLSPDKIAERGIGRTYQNIRLFSGMTTVENVLVGMHTRLRSGVIGSILGTPATQREEREALAKAMELLDFVGLTEVGDVPWRQSQPCYSSTNPRQG